MQEIKSYLGWKVDYLNPPGEPAFAGPDSVSWQVFKNPIALAIGGVAAVLLEFADARIRSGVWDHSVFKVDPIGRSLRTGLAGALGIYGPQSAARRVIQGVTNMHAKVEGKTPSGEAYKALDVELLDWVSATAGYAFLMGYHRFVRRLSDEEIAVLLSQVEPSQRLFGVQNPIRSFADFDAMLEKLLPRFEPHPINDEFLEIMKSGRAAPHVPVWLQRAFVNASVDILPPAVRERLELGPEYDLKWWQAAAIRLVGQLAERIPDKKGIAAQSCERLGLPRDFLWKSKKTQQKLLAERGPLSEMYPAE